MNISKEDLMRIIKEEVANAKEQTAKPKTITLNRDSLNRIIKEEIQAFRRRQLRESKRVVKATPDMLKQIIKEELDRAQR